MEQEKNERRSPGVKCDRLIGPGRVKVLFHDGSGMVLVAKWPDRGSFRWPPVSEGLLRLSRVEFLALFDVCDWRGLKAPRRAVRG